MRLFLVLLVSSISLFADHSKKIDSFINQTLKKEQKTASPKLSDYAFARKAHLAIIGRIPTKNELQKFIQNPDRAKLIDSLLANPARVSHDYNFWADLLRVKDGIAGVSMGFTGYQNWIRQSLSENIPYDKFVTELVTAQGISSENGAVGFYLRDRGMPLDHLANTAQIFLGTRLACAQCHDHPFEDWTQMEFYKLAAFTYPMVEKSLPPHIQKPITAMNLPRKQNPMGALVKPIRNSTIEEIERKLKLPHDYQYDDAKPKSVVYPETIFGHKIKAKEGQSRSQVYAAWMTSKENPRFAKVIANRMWKRVMGIGIIEPVDDLDAGREVGDPKLLEYLTKLLIELDFDLLKFQKALYKTDLFSRTAIPHDLTSKAKFLYQGPRHRRMSAEQLWDSIGSLLRPDFDSTFQLNKEPYHYAQKKKLYKKISELKEAEKIVSTAREIDSLIELANQQTIEFRNELEKIDKNDKTKADDWFNRFISLNTRQLVKYAKLTGLGDDHIDARSVPIPFNNIRQPLSAVATRKFPHLREKHRDHFARETPEYIRTKGKENKKKEELMREYNEVKKQKGGAAAQKFITLKRNQAMLSHFKRASEYGNPSPPSHLLREFGQSDRELINNSRTSMTIPLLLEFRNGNLVKHLQNEESQMSKGLRGINSKEKIIENLYLQMLSRLPEKEEVQLILPEFGDSKEKGIQNTVFLLLNTSEFVFIP